MLSNLAGVAIDMAIEDKLASLRRLQAELEAVIAEGLMSLKRQKWLADKNDLVARQMECNRGWADLKARQQSASQAWEQLSETATSEHSPAAAASSALVVAKELTLSQLLSKTSLREQMELIQEHAELSQKQLQLDKEDERLMLEALQLYQEERPDRERRESIVKQQEGLLMELEQLIEDKSSFAGHATFTGGDTGFIEGMLY